MEPQCARRRAVAWDLDGDVELPLHRAQVVCRGVDRHQILKVREKTLEAYKKQLNSFVAWYLERNLRWTTLLQLDILIVEWKNDITQRVSKAHLANLVAGVELVMPWAKGHLAWSHAVIAGWSSPLRSTTPSQKTT